MLRAEPGTSQSSPSDQQGNAAQRPNQGMQRAIRSFARPLSVVALLALTTLFGAATAVAQTTTIPVGDITGSGWELDLTSSSHVVRAEEEFANVRFGIGEWRYETLLGSIRPRFRNSHVIAGVGASRRFGNFDVLAVLRYLDTDGGQDIVTSVRLEQNRDNGGRFGGELTYGQADLASDLFLLSDEEDQVIGRFFWQSADGLEVMGFVHSQVRFDLMRGSRELLQPLPRTVIARAETLGDLDLDEGRLEDSVGASVAFEHGIFSATVYAKSGEQTLRGIGAPDDFVGFGGDFDLKGKSWSLHTELDVRQLETVDNISFDRARVLVDFRHDVGRFEWGSGIYLQGESETFTEIADLYETAGVGAFFAINLKSGNQLGFLAAIEDDAPDFHTITRLGFFLKKSDREWGVGVRRDEVGRVRFAEETFGPFVFGRLPFKNLFLDGTFGVQDSDVYGSILIGVRR